MHYTICDDIYFIEGCPNGYTPIRECSVELGGIITEAQLKSLRDVKHKMAIEARDSGGNAIVDFTYGQKSVGFLRSITQLDDVNWYGKGIIANIDIDSVP